MTDTIQTMSVRQRSTWAYVLALQLRNIWTTPSAKLNACKDAADLLEHQAARITELEAQLSAAQPVTAEARVEGGQSAKERYVALNVDAEESDPIERLRFFCSLAMNGQDWLDAEAFFEALTARATETLKGFEAWAQSEGLIYESHGVLSVNSNCGIARKAWDAACAATAASE